MKNRLIILLPLLCVICFFDSFGENKEIDETKKQCEEEILDTKIIDGLKITYSISNQLSPVGDTYKYSYSFDLGKLMAREFEGNILVSAIIMPWPDPEIGIFITEVDKKYTFELIKAKSNYAKMTSYGDKAKMTSYGDNAKLRKEEALFTKKSIKISEKLAKRMQTIWEVPIMKISYNRIDANTGCDGCTYEFGVKARGAAFLRGQQWMGTKPNILTTICTIILENEENLNEEIITKLLDNIKKETPANSLEEDDLKITNLKIKTNGDAVFYIKFDTSISPSPIYYKIEKAKVNSYDPDILIKLDEIKNNGGEIDSKYDKYLSKIIIKKTSFDSEYIKLNFNKKYVIEVSSESNQEILRTPLIINGDIYSSLLPPILDIKSMSNMEFL